MKKSEWSEAEAGRYLPPKPFSMTSIWPLAMLLRPSNCWTVHLYHLMRNTRSVRPWDTITRFISIFFSPGGWNLPIFMSALSVSLNPVFQRTPSSYFHFYLFKQKKLNEWRKNLPNLTCDSVINISGGFTVRKSVKETPVQQPHCFLHSHLLSILEIPFLPWINQ